MNNKSIVCLALAACAFGVSSIAAARCESNVEVDRTKTLVMSKDAYLLAIGDRNKQTQTIGGISSGCSNMTLGSVDSKVYSERAAIGSLGDDNEQSQNIGGVVAQ